MSSAIVFAWCVVIVCGSAIGSFYLGRHWGYDEGYDDALDDVEDLLKGDGYNE